MQNLSLYDQDLCFLNPERRLQDFISDSRLNLSNVSRDSRLSVHGTSFPDLKSSMQE